MPRIHRRGTIYVAVLGTAMLVSLLGLSAITVTRIQSRGSVGSGDIEDARLYARAAIEYGRLWVNNDPNWRTDHNSGTWVNGQKIGYGKFSLAGINPNSPNLNNAPDDPVVLTGTGVKGKATQMMQVKLTAVSKPLTCLAVALDAVNAVTITSATVNADKALCTNAAFTALLSTVNAPVEAGLSVSGLSGNLLAVTASATPRTFPTASTVFTYFTSHGTSVSFGSIPGGKINGQVLSPANNPFGGATNAMGIYVIDCGGSSLTITNSRIVGTLILLNAGGTTNVQGSCNWAPFVTNYPALMVQGPLTLKPGNTALSEASTGANFNPAGTPYAGASNATTTDSYPSQIQGLIYCSGNLTSSVHPVVKGVVITGGTWTAGGAMDITYDSVYQQNPPPGFSASQQMTISDGTWQQAVN